MEYFKIKHKPTGLYYKPLKGNGCNLSTRGKIYDNNYMWNQLMNDTPYCYNVLAIFNIKRPGDRKSKDDIVNDIGWAIHLGTIPCKKKWDSSHIFDDGGICIDMEIITNPEDWEKEFI